jgi:hypothetical protein
MKYILPKKNYDGGKLLSSVSIWIEFVFWLMKLKIYTKFMQVSRVFILAICNRMAYQLFFFS